MEQLNSNNISAAQVVRKRYEQEFIQQVLGVYQSGVYATLEECACAYSVPKKTLSGWISRYRKKMTPDLVLQQQSELSRLKKELAQAKMELDILKKASIYFASQAR
jgi:transposase